ncbi:NAD(P)/FAD-dependent oxidoreductase [Xanthomonas sp. CFBP 8703]|uniref:Tryptophan 2-monooxygenase n=2 Tax=Xanthomonas bonasiae TaxID=2810351 RepID=A0ABS3B1P7_9XANT|nr:NAD(P)/FAD-dependent oxidoreductase [Xanthomonas bonasiae]MBN6102529.1 NAD(P)/FAD-dependent oxidoreductase [Xanthomonas bonasiae]MBN6113333.1 NAD(P)/FAD-dependent oxidoreductase [Xanthomonas bonasiae]
MTRRQLLARIGLAGGGAMMYQAMHSLGLAAESRFGGVPRLDGDAKGASVLVLGAGLAGLTAAYELRKAGYRVQVLEYNARPGGRNWTLRGGDRYTELGGFEQQCGFDEGMYLNPGPWRIPHHHKAVLSYCKQFGVALEPFVQVNFNALLHSREGFGGKPQRFRDIDADYKGHVAELLAKSTRQGALDAQVQREDQEILLESLRNWGALDKDFGYVKGRESSERRGFAKYPGGGLSGKPQFSEPFTTQDILRSRLWTTLAAGNNYEMQTAMFQPVGGMDQIGKAFARELGDAIRYNARVTRIDQDAHGVSVAYQDGAGAEQLAKADWCVCTIPLSILSRIPLAVGEKMAAAIGQVPYAASVKVGLQFKRRFWEEDEAIYGGISYTDLPITLISYPSTGFQSAGKGVLLGAYVWGLEAFEFTSMTPQQRVAKAVEYGTQLHPQYPREFDNGIAVGWHRVPFTHGCFGVWSDAARAEHYENLCRIDGRIALAGEHASYIPAWQEGAITSALDAIERLHRRVVNGARA